VRTVRTLLSHLGRIKVTVVYAVALAVTAELLLRLSPRAQHDLIRDTSTNLHNLGEGRLTTLIGSAFVNEAGPLYFWLPGLVALLAAGELLWQSRRLVTAFVIGHIGATLIVAGALAGGLAAGLLSRSVADAADVGMSYGAVGVLGSLTAAIPRPWRGVWAGWWLAVAVTSIVLGGLDFTNAGHGVALLLGMAVGSRFDHPVRWTAVRAGLLVLGAGFGYLLMAYQDIFAPQIAILGVVGGLAGWALSALATTQTNSSAHASIQSDNQASGGLSSRSPGINHS
jgi:hypothetical protein